MKYQCPLMLLLLGALMPCCVVAPSYGQAVQPSSESTHRFLRFVKEIGVGWKTEKFGWMGFVSFSPDGSMVASDGATAPDDVSGNLSLWSFPEGRLINQVPSRPSAISGDWKYYATFHGVNAIETGRTLISLGNNAYAMHAFSPDSHYVAESFRAKSTHDARIRVMELPSGKQVSAFGKREAFSMAISPNGRTLASGHWKVVKLWDAFSGKRIEVLHGFDRYVQGLSFSPDGTLLAAGNDFGKVQIWDLIHRKMVYSIDVGGGEVSQPAFSPDGRFVAVGIYGTGTVWLIDVASGNNVDSYRVSDLGCGAVAFSPDGRFIITPSTGGLIKWPYDRGGTIRAFEIGAR